MFPHSLLHCFCCFPHCFLFCFFCQLLSVFVQFSPHLLHSFITASPYDFLVVPLSLPSLFPYFTNCFLVYFPTISSPAFSVLSSQFVPFFPRGLSDYVLCIFLHRFLIASPPRVALCSSSSQTTQLMCMFSAALLIHLQQHQHKVSQLPLCPFIIIMFRTSWCCGSAWMSCHDEYQSSLGRGREGCRWTPTQKSSGVTVGFNSSLVSLTTLFFFLLTICNRSIQSERLQYLIHI